MSPHVASVNRRALVQMTFLMTMHKKGVKRKISK